MKKQKRLQELVFPLALVLLFSFFTATAFAFHEYSVALSGKNEPHSVKTGATGKAVFRIITDHGPIALDYVLDVKNIKDVTVAHLGLGGAKKSGPRVVDLFTGPTKKGGFTGTLAKGRISDKDLIGPLAGKTISDLQSEIKKGNVYLDVHTTAHPDGEIRGQLK